MKKFRKIAALSLALSMFVALNSAVWAHGDEAQGAPQKVENAEPVELSEWDGQFNSAMAYFDNEEVKNAFNSIAEKSGKSADDLMNESKAMFDSDFKAIEIEGDTVRYFNGIQEQGAQQIAEVKYAYEATYSEQYGNFPIEWTVFKAVEGDQYKYLLMMPLHGEEMLLHFHMRYGNDLDELFAKKDWWPTLVKTDTSAEQFAQMVVAHASHDEDAEAEEHEHSDLPKGEVLEDVSLSDWDGYWNNMGAYLKDDELQSAFETLAKNEGKELTEARAAYKNKRQADFDGILVEGNTISFLDGVKDSPNTDVLSKAEYTYKESYKVKHGNFDLEWHLFTTEDENALYPQILLMGVHGEEVLVHFHMRYGQSVEEMLKHEGWYPTFVKPDSTIDQLAAEITE